MDTPEVLTLNGREYAVLRLLGKGKGGYTWLARRDGARYALKQIHHEPCQYYAFGDKMAAELRDYETLRALSGALWRAGLNIDWFPTNFMCRDKVLYYVDYECNPYMEQWSFEGWGARYWRPTPELEAYAKEHGDL